MFYFGSIIVYATNLMDERATPFRAFAAPILIQTKFEERFRQIAVPSSSIFVVEFEKMKHFCHPIFGF